MSHQQLETKTNHIQSNNFTSIESKVFEKEEIQDKGFRLTQNHSSAERENGIDKMPSVQTGGWTENCAPSPITVQNDLTDDLKAKKARVENIISTMQLSSPTGGTKDLESQKRKRKQYLPQPQRLELDGELEEPAAKKKTPMKKGERQHLKYLLHHLQQQLDVLQERYQDLYDDENHSESEESDDLDDINEPFDTSNAIRKSELMNGNVSKFAIPQGTFDLGQEKAKLLRKYLKSRLAETIYSSVDSIVDSIIQKPSQKMKQPVIEVPKPSVIAHTNSTKSPSPVTTTLSVPNRSSSRSMYTSQSPSSHVQTEALSLVVPTRKSSPPSERVKSKTPPSTSSNSGYRFLPASSLATSVAVPNPTLHHHPFAGTFLTPPLTNGFDVLESLSRYSNSPLLSYAGMSQVSPFQMSDHHSSPRSTPPSMLDAFSSVKSEMSDGSPASLTPDLSDYSYAAGSTVTSTLTPTHLRKAKLMFFFTRYPSSAILRQHFVDVKFNRHNTSQIIKWFSNFREFFYIQMEKFARQALSSGVTDPEELEVSRDSELFRALNLHYNKSNEYRPPDSFMTVCTTTLREFFVAVKTGRDAEASWKKSIYKVISKLDEPIPSLFRSPNCLEQLTSA